MYKHILIPTDGSPLAARGAKAGVKLARALGAKVTALYVATPYAPAVYGDAAVYYADRRRRSTSASPRRRRRGARPDRD